MGPFGLTRCMAAAAGAAALFGTGFGAAAQEPEKPSQIVVRIWEGTWNDAMRNTAARVFTEQTGIPVNFDNRTDSVMITLVQTALAQNREPPIDVFYTYSPQDYEAVVKNITEQMTPEEIPNLAAMLPAAKPDFEGWPYVSVTAPVVGVIYRESAFPDGIEESYSVLYDRKFEGRVHFSHSSYTNIAMAAMLNGYKVPEDMDKIWEFIKEKQAPMRPIMGSMDGVFMNAFQLGEIDLGVSYPSNARKLKAAGVDAAIMAPKEGLIAFYESVFVPKGLPENRAYWAKQFINTLLSEEVMQGFCGELAIVCLRSGVEPPAAVADDPTFPDSPDDFERFYVIDADVVLRERSGWDAQYRELVAR